MIAKCANPSCSAPFLYLHEGRLFKIDVGAGPPGNGASLPRQVEYFWLCQACARTMTVEMRDGKVTTRRVRRTETALMLPQAAGF